MLPEQKRFSNLAEQARGGDARAVAQLHTEIDPHLERIIQRALSRRKPRTELDRQLRAMARHANALERVPRNRTGRGVVRRLVQGIYDTLWSSYSGQPQTVIALAHTTRC